MVPLPLCFCTKRTRNGRRKQANANRQAAGFHSFLFSNSLEGIIDVRSRAVIITHVDCLLLHENRLEANRISLDAPCDGLMASRSSCRRVLYTELAAPCACTCPNTLPVRYPADALYLYRLLIGADAPDEAAAAAGQLGAYAVAQNPLAVSTGGSVAW